MCKVNLRSPRDPQEGLELKNPGEIQIYGRDHHEHEESYLQLSCSDEMNAAHKLRSKRIRGKSSQNLIEIGNWKIISEVVVVVDALSVAASTQVFAFELIYLLFQNTRDPISITLFSTLQLLQNSSHTLLL